LDYCERITPFEMEGYTNASPLADHQNSNMVEWLECGQLGRIVRKNVGVMVHSKLLEM